MFTAAYAVTDLSEIAGQLRSAAGGAYYEFPQAGGRPFWQGSLFVLGVAALHLLGLLLAFGVVVGHENPDALPPLTVRVLDPSPAAPPMATAGKVAAARSLEAARRAEPVHRVERAKPVAVPQSASSSPPANANAPVAVAVAQPGVGVPVDSSAASTASAAASAPALVGARFDADYLHNPRPAYPLSSRRLGEEGRVVLRVRVSAQGLPLAIEVKQSSGSPRLDEAARVAVERWRFVPARLGSEAVESSVLVPLQFALDS